MKIKITTESTVDLTKELLKEYNIGMLPYEILLKDKMVIDGEIFPEDMFNYVDKTKTLPKTAAINETRYEEFFKENLSGYDALIHITLSAELTVGHINALKAAEKLDNVYVIDSRSLSTGIALTVIYACELAKQGLKAQEIVEKVKARIPHVQASFVLDRLDYLYKGGRCNALSKIFASILRIHPQILVKDGKMTTGKKFIGNIESCTEKYLKATLEEFNNPDKNIVFITYSTATENMLNSARAILKEAGFKRILETRAGSTIGSHCGRNCIGILYINDGGSK